VGADEFAEADQPLFGGQAREAAAVDGDDLVTGLQHLGRRATLAHFPHALGNLFLAVDPVDAEEDRESEDDVHRRASRDDDDPLPDRLAEVGVGFVLRRHVLLRIHPGDFHVAADRDRFHPVLGFAPLDRPNRRPEEKEEALDPHARRLGGEEVTRLVEDDQQAEPDEDPEPAHAGINPRICSSLRSRASASPPAPARSPPGCR
jgi:hypothetical protein